MMWLAASRLSQLIQPERPMDAKASSINGIYDEDLVGQPTFVQFHDELMPFLDGALLVAHNAAFDAGFLGMELFIMDGKTAVLPNPWLCTLQLARRHFYFGRNNLGAISRRLGVRMGQAHRALSDVYMTAEILKRMTRQLTKQNLLTVGDLLHAQGGAIYPPPPPDPFLPPPLDVAVADGRPLHILYLSRGGETERTITPRYVGEHNGVGYLIAHCHLRNAPRTFRLDGILSATLV
ncbi:MAG: exonuclease domain-containing protein [Anaerolineae bacterium]